MRDLMEHYNACMELLAEIGIEPPAEKIKSVSVDRRSTKTWGKVAVHWRNKAANDVDFFEIKIREMLLLDVNPIDELENVILHEILHTMPGCQNHGAVWQAHADRVNAALGVHISQYADAENIKFDPYAEREKRYAVRCTACGNIIYRQNFSDVIRFPGLYHCSCGGDLERIK